MPEPPLTMALTEGRAHPRSQEVTGTPRWPTSNLEQSLQHTYIFCDALTGETILVLDTNGRRRYHLSQRTLVDDRKHQLIVGIVVLE